MTRFKWLATCLLILAFTGCDEYPEGAAVAIRMKGASSQYKPVAEFESWLLERMNTFSKAKGDFSVVGGVLGDTEPIPAGATHVFTVSIDSVNLVPFQKYKGAVDTANMIRDKVAWISYVIGGTRVGGTTIGETSPGIIINRIVYGTQTHPVMGVSLSIQDVKTHRNTWDYSKQIDLESNAAIPEGEQLDELLAVLKSFVADEAGFLKEK